MIDRNILNVISSKRIKYLINATTTALFHATFERPSEFSRRDKMLKYGFCNKSFWKNETLASWTLLQQICPHFWAWLLNTKAIKPKSEDKYVVKVFNWPEFHLSEMTLLQNPYFSYVKNWNTICNIKSVLASFLVCLQPLHLSKANILCENKAARGAKYDTFGFPDCSCVFFICKY